MSISSCLCFPLTLAVYFTAVGLRGWIINSKCLSYSLAIQFASLSIAKQIFILSVAKNCNHDDIRHNVTLWTGRTPIHPSGNEWRGGEEKKRATNKARGAQKGGREGGHDFKKTKHHAVPLLRDHSHMMSAVGGWGTDMAITLLTPVSMLFWNFVKKSSSLVAIILDFSKVTCA